MPITVKVSEGLLSTEKAKRLTKEITDIFLKTNDVYGNQFMSKNQIADLMILPEGYSFSGLGPCKFVLISCLVPTIALPTEELRAAFVTDVTEAVVRASGGGIDPDMITIDMTYGVMWGIGGQLFTDEELARQIMVSKKN